MAHLFNNEVTADFISNHNVIGKKLADQKIAMTTNIAGMTVEERSILIDSYYMMGKRGSPSSKLGKEIVEKNNKLRLEADEERKKNGKKISNDTVHQKDLANVKTYGPIWDKAFKGIEEDQRNWRPLAEFLQVPMKPIMEKVVAGKWNSLRYANSKMVFSSFTLEEAIKLYEPVLKGLETLAVDFAKGDNDFPIITQRGDFVMTSADRWPIPSKLPLERDASSWTNSDMLAVAYVPKITAWHQCTDTIANANSGTTKRLENHVNKIMERYGAIYFALFGGSFNDFEDDNGQTITKKTEQILNPIRIVFSEVRKNKSDQPKPTGKGPRRDIVVRFKTATTVPVLPK